MSELPTGWTEAEIGELCDLINGRAFKPTDWTESGLPIVRIQNLNNPDKPFNRFDGEVRERFLIDSGDLLFAWSGTPGTSFGAHVWTGGPAVLNQHIFNVKFDRESLDREFFRHAINQKLNELIDKAHGGVGLRHVTKGKFEETKVSLPPLPEQRRIVRKLDTLGARTTTARTHLTAIAKLVERYRQSVIDAAFAQFELTVPLLDLVDRDTGIPYGIVQTGEHQVGGIPTVRAGDIKGFRLMEEGLKLVDPTIAEQYERTRLEGGEVLIAIRGSVGETCVVPNSMRSNNISREVALIPVDDNTDANFIMYFLRSGQAAQFIKANIKGVAQTGINLRDLKRLPCPDLEQPEQREIVRRIETAFAKIDRLAAEAEKALKLTDRLDQRILAKAFAGELVPQDPTDEPAAELLARIRETRATAPKPKRGRRKKAEA
ncbi:type I restriction enzyme S subunit [Rhodobacter sp. JA431]|uniref:restriction endonuclease subunit S n=1 Tax=Rhodobacter sp. JA431 TaxID=570013 RepID=UPI000BCAA19D|nr:restriction endonuclease subunit S [Rhodobacter sp. JA431]SOC05747.1 type I restriction enzyme S subunit [Rhodobacter sp. JA431]